MSAPLHVFGALALEVAAPPARDTLAPAAAETLAAHVADDLQRVLPGVATLDLVLAGAHYDPAELLRPRWPVHAALAELAARLPQDARGRVVAIGAAPEWPLPALQPDPALHGGPLRLLPFALLGAASATASIAAQLEATLLQTGMAGAATALHAQHAFGARIEHARYLSLHDLVAMTALQYEHAGLGPLWPLLEAALLAPDAEEWLDSGAEPLLRHADGEVRIARCDAAAWDARGAPVAWRAYRQRVQQFVAVLGAHGLAPRIVDVGAGEDAHARLRSGS